MKRLHIITKPTAVNDFADNMYSDDYEGSWELRAERREAQEHRKFRRNN